MTIWEHGWNVLKTIFGSKKGLRISATIPLGTGYRKKMPKHSEVNWSKFVSLGRQLVGKPYNFGVEVNLKETDAARIKAIDCSELVEWLYAQVGIIS